MILLITFEREGGEGCQEKEVERLDREKGGWGSWLVLGFRSLPGTEVGLGRLGMVPRTRCRLLVEEKTPVRVLDVPQVCPRVIKGSM